MSISSRTFTLGTFRGASLTVKINVVFFFHVHIVFSWFRELVDAECYRLAFQFVCHVLQPPCHPPSESSRSAEAAIIRPCQDFCLDFWAGCGPRLPLRFQEVLECSRFPEVSTVGEACVPKPGNILEEVKSAIL